MELSRLEKMFDQERSRFARVYPKCAIATVRLVRFRRDAFRDFARCEVTSRRMDVQFHPLALEYLDEYNIRALIRHELGHCCEPDFNERQVDALAAVIGGEIIYYDENDIQTTLGGVHPRPPYLHKRSG